jgi:hypothetical protein
LILDFVFYKRLIAVYVIRNSDIGKRLANKIDLIIPDANTICLGDLLFKLPQLQSLIINSGIYSGVYQKTSEKYFLN